MIRKLSILGISLALLISPALAQRVVNPGMTPKSPFYGLDKAWDRLNYLMRAPFPKAQASYGLKIARERVAEAKHMERACERMNRTVAKRRCHRRMRRCRRRAEDMLNKTKEIRRRRGRPKWAGPRIPEDIGEIEKETEIPTRHRGRRGRPW